MRPESYVDAILARLPRGPICKDLKLEPIQATLRLPELPPATANAKEAAEATSSTEGDEAA